MRKKLITLLGLAAIAAGAECSPVRSDLGADGAESSAAWNPTAADYIQDGLIAIWDGIENAGWGVNDKSVNYWEELVGGTRVIKTSPGVREWSATGDSMEVPPSDTSPSPVVNSILSQDIVVNARCFEVVGYRTMDSDKRSTLLYNCSDRYFVFAAAVLPNCPVYQRWYLCSAIKPTMATGDELYRSSEYLVGLYNPASTWKNNFRAFGGVSSDPWCGICAIRLYNRELSEIEIAYNYLIDRLRFNF